MTDDLRIVIAFPIAEAQRELLRGMSEAPLPALYVDGETRSCTSCQMALNVGPRTLADGSPIYCVICALHYVKMHGAETTDVLSLGNPDSRAEKR